MIDQQMLGEAALLAPFAAGGCFGTLPSLILWLPLRELAQGETTPNGDTPLTFPKAKRATALSTVDCRGPPWEDFVERHVGRYQRSCAYCTDAVV